MERRSEAARGVEIHMTQIEELARMVLLCRDYVADNVSDYEICRSFENTRVLFVSDLRNLSSHSGQTALSTLVSLVSRMGMQVSLAIPNVPILFSQPPFSGSELKTALVNASSRLVTCATISSASYFDCDLAFVLGDTDFGKGGSQCWRLTGTDWSGRIAKLCTEAATSWSVKWPVGAMVAAAMAASEAFKFAMRRLPFRSRGDQIFFEQSTSCEWSFGECPVGQGALSVGAVDIVSAGAISQAALYALARFSDLKLSARIFDHDLTSSSNLNRNMLSLTSDVGRAKVKTVADRCDAFNIESVLTRFTKDTASAQLAPMVLVGVDDIPSRWEVQRDDPMWLAVSGTSHFSVSSSSHKQDQACAGCLHPIADDGMRNEIPTVSFVSFWAGLSMAVRLIREALNQPYMSDRQHLWLTPLRMDLPHSAMWLPVAARADCPVACVPSTLMFSHNSMA
jgi:hypothetical protein